MNTLEPNSPHVSDAVAHVKAVLHPQIYNHSIRTFLLGMRAAVGDGVSDIDTESLCLAAIVPRCGNGRSV